MTDANGNVLDNLVKGLRKQLGDVEAREAEQQTSLAETRQQVKRLTSALAALDGKETPKRGPKRQASREEIVTVISSVLADGKELHREALLERTRDKLPDKSKRGLDALFDDALTDASFENGDGGYRLRPQSEQDLQAEQTSGWSGEELR